MSQNLYEQAYFCLIETSLAGKLERAQRLNGAWHAGKLTLEAIELPDVIEAGRPAKPELVDPKSLAKRRLGSVEGQAAMVHAIAHIEFNAINLACDAVYRFRDMPSQYYGDWLQVAAEEAEHFALLQNRLHDLGYGYGDFSAHNGLWELAVKTASDPLLRMALVPRVMEARGLDVTPDISHKFAQIGDQATVNILKIILRDEIGHVAAGTRWFHFLCEQRDLEPESTFFRLLEEQFEQGLRCPLHKEARRQAGFTEGELGRLEALCKKSS